MGLTDMRTLRALAICMLSALHLGASAASTTQLEERAWPQASGCDPCFTIQFGKLEMQFSPKEITRVLIASSDASPLHLFLPGPHINPHSMTFLTQGDERFSPYIRKGLFKEYGIKTKRDFFEAIGHLPKTGDTGLGLMRKIEGIDNAEHYVETSKGALHVFWIKAAEGNTQNIYFVLEGNEVVYQLSGDITEDIFRATLGRLRLADIP